MEHSRSKRCTTSPCASAALTDAQRAHILGVQANLWTEHVRTEDRAEYMIFPRAAAIAEVGWSPSARIDFQSFSARLPDQLARYQSLGVGFARAPEPPINPGVAPATSWSRAPRRSCCRSRTMHPCKAIAQSFWSTS